MVLKLFIVLIGVNFLLLLEVEKDMLEIIFYVFFMFLYV